MPDKQTQTSVQGLPLSRRQFMQLSGMAVVGIYIGACDPGKETVTWGFLLVDMKKCQGCMSCMLACSLVHHGEINPCLSRLQIQQDPYGKYPDDLTIVQCRQCVDPACLAACPTGALARDPEHGDVTTVDMELCIGCKSCVNACPHSPGRALWNAADRHAQKCDLCANTPHWDQTGGPGGKQACVEACPMGALQFTQVVPDQDDPDSYSVNLRDWQWKKLGYPLL